MLATAPSLLVLLQFQVLALNFQNGQENVRFCKGNMSFHCRKVHVSLSEAGLAMAKRVFHPSEAERWPSAEASSFMKKYLTLIPNQKISLESDLYQEPFI